MVEHNGRRPGDLGVAEVVRGEIVWCRTGTNEWVRKRAISGPCYDPELATGAELGKSIPVVDVSESNILNYVNWPARDVQRQPPRGSSHMDSTSHRAIPKRRG